MARIFDNMDNDLLTTLRATLQVSHHSDFCVGCLNLRDWQAIDDLGMQLTWFKTAPYG